MKNPTEQAGSPAPAGSANDRCCALTASDEGISECGKPATYRSHGGKLYCHEHAKRRLDLGSKCYPILEDRPDPKGLRLILRVARHQTSPAVVAKDFRLRASRFWDFSVEVSAATFKATIGILLIPVGLLWLAVGPIYTFLSNILWAVLKPDEARKAFRILDGLPAKPSPNATGSATPEEKP